MEKEYATVAELASAIYQHAREIGDAKLTALALRLILAEQNRRNQEGLGRVVE